jgi:glycosyltransferase involved in cell wall biosynthesis
MALRGHEIRVIDHQFQWREDQKGEVLPKRVIVPRAYKIYPEAGDRITLVRPRAVKISGLNTASIVPFHLSEILRQVREFKPDLILAFGILNAHLGLKVAQRHNIPFIYYLIDQLHTLLVHPFKRVIAERVERWNLQSADEVLVINRALKEYAKVMGAPESRISVITAGVNFKRFDRTLDGHVVRERYGVAPDEILLLFTGYLYSFSGLKEVARDILSGPSKRVKLMAVGDGDLLESLAEMTASPRANGSIILPGKVPFDEVPQYVAAADICLLPAYRNEIMMHIVPIKMYEYMAMAKPVIATNLPGIVQEFGTNNGILYVERPEDVVAKAREMTDRGVMREEGEKASTHVAGSDWDTIVDEFEAKLQQAITKRREQTIAKAASPPSSSFWH